MNRVTYLTVVALLMAGGVVACDNRRGERSGGAETGTGTGAATGGETGTTADTAMAGGGGRASETGRLSEQDKKEGRVLETPGDSVRLEDTLSDPAPTSDTIKK